MRLAQILGAPAAAAVLVAVSVLQFKDRPDVLDLMRRHPTWPGSKQHAAAAAAGPAGDSEVAPTAHPASPGHGVQTTSYPASAQIDGGAACTPGASIHVKTQRAYTSEEQAVMQELGVSSLTNIGRQNGFSTSWRVQFRAAGLGGPPCLTGKRLRWVSTWSCCVVQLCA
jgi:hypothetical protein